MDRLRYWGRVMRAGFPTVPVIVGYIALIVGGSIALVFTWSRKHLLWGIVLLLLGVVITILEGSYRQYRLVNQAYTSALADLEVAQRSAVYNGRARDLQYCLAINIDGVVVTEPVDPEHWETGYRFRINILNKSDQIIGYEVEYINITLDGEYTARPDQRLGPDRGFIGEDNSTPYYYDIRPAPIDPPLSGRGEYTISYWHPANGIGSPRFKTHQEFSLRWLTQPGREADAEIILRDAPTHDQIEDLRESDIQPINSVI